MLPTPAEDANPVGPIETNFGIMLGTTGNGKVKLQLHTVLGTLFFVIDPNNARGIGAGLMAEADLADLQSDIVVPDMNELPPDWWKK